MSYVKEIYLDGLHIDDEIIYTDEELAGILKDYEERVIRKAEFKMWCEEFLK